MSSSGVMSSNEASNNPGLFSVEGQFPSLSGGSRDRDQFSTLSLSIVKTPSHFHMLVFSSAFYLILVICLENPKVGSDPTN
jgi:hypothetical protein